jgi:hypothetical protein
MAYPTVDAPYGFKPVNLIGGLPFAGATRSIPIASGYATSIYNGDVVELTSNGVIQLTAMTGATTTTPVVGTIGVFLGCSYTNPSTKQKLFSQYYPGGTVAADIVAYVCDDPNALFKVVNVTGTTADGAASGLLPAYVTRANAMGANVAFVNNTGLVATGNSRAAVYANNVTTGLPFRVVDVVPDTANASGNFVELIVKFNAGYHSYNNLTGI